MTEDPREPIVISEHIDTLSKRTWVVLIAFPVLVSAIAGVLDLVFLEYVREQWPSERRNSYLTVVGVTYIGTLFLLEKYVGKFRRCDLPGKENIGYKIVYNFIGFLVIVPFYIWSAIKFDALNDRFFFPWLFFLVFARAFPGWIRFLKSFNCWEGAPIYRLDDHTRRGPWSRP